MKSEMDPATIAYNCLQELLLVKGIGYKDGQYE